MSMHEREHHPKIIQRPREKTPTTPITREVVPVVETVSLFENQRNEEQREAQTRREEFQEESQTEYESKGVEAYVAHAEKFYRDISATYAANKDTIHENERFRHHKASIEQYLRKAASKFNPKLAKKFSAWIDQLVQNPDSNLNKMAAGRAMQELLAPLAKEMADHLEISPISVEELKKEGALIGIIKRVENIENLTKRLQSDHEEYAIADLAFVEFFHTQITASQKEIQKKRETTMGRLFTKEQTDDELFAELISDKTKPPTMPEWFKKGREMLQSSETSSQLWEPPGTPELLRTLQTAIEGETYDGTEEERATVEGKTECGPIAMLYIETARPVLQEPYVRKLKINPGKHEKDEELYGLFTKTTKEMNIHQTKIRKESEVIHTISHEIGHALRPEDMLPLREAIRFTFDVRRSIDSSGYSSWYVEEAMETKMEELEHTSDSAHTNELKINDTELSEEWAEMVANAVVLPPAIRLLQPEKEMIVRDILARYGLDLTTLQSVARMATRYAPADTDTNLDRFIQTSLSP